MLGFMADVRRECGETMNEQILGGGFGIKYVEGARPVEYHRYLEQVAGEIDAVCEELKFPRPFIYLEPGRSIVGSAGVTLIRNRRKMLHRAEFGISILQAYNGLGIGDALTEQCIACAKQAGFLQLELEVVAENEKAIRLYQKHGFVEYGRNPLGFRCGDGHWQELVLMRLELGDR